MFPVEPEHHQLLMIPKVGIYDIEGSLSLIITDRNGFHPVQSYSSHNYKEGKPKRAHNLLTDTAREIVGTVENEKKCISIMNI